MDLSAFQSFLMLAETLSFTKAAEKLYKSEPVLSRQITKLEHELGLKLFHRSTKSVSLTPAGMALAKGVSSILKNYEAMLDEACAVQSGLSGVVKIACLPGLHLHETFIETVLAFENEYPDIQIQITALNLIEQRSMLKEFQLDFVFGATRDFSSYPDFILHVLCSARNCIAIPKKLGLHTDKKGLKLIDLKDETFILSAESEKPFTMIQFTRFYESLGFTPRCIAAPNLSTLMLWLELSRGIAPLNEITVLKNSENLDMLALPELGYTDLALIWNRDQTNACAETFIRFVLKQ